MLRGVPVVSLGRQWRMIQAKLPGDWAHRFEQLGVQWLVYSPLGSLGLLWPGSWRRQKQC